MFKTLPQDRFKIYFLLGFFIVSSVFGGCGGGGDQEKAPGVMQSAPVGPESTVPSVDQLKARGRAVDAFTYDYVMTLPDGSSLKQKVWVKAHKMRIEIKDPASNDDALAAIADLSAEEVFFYQPALKQAARMPLEYSELDTTSPKDYLEEFAPANARFIKKEQFAGKPCLAYEIKINDETSTVWVWEEFGLPVYVEIQYGEGKLTVEFQNLTLGDIEDSRFTLPKGTLIN